MKASFIPTAFNRYPVANVELTAKKVKTSVLTNRVVVIETKGSMN